MSDDARERGASLAAAASLADGIAACLAEPDEHDREAMLVAFVAAREAELHDRVRALEGELDALIYAVSHDTQMPIRAITGFSDILLRDHASDLDQDVRHMISRVRANTLRLGHLHSDLLRLSRASRAPLAVEEVDVSALAGELVQAREAKNVSVHIAPDLTVHADPHLLRTALEAIIDNAYKFTHDVADRQVRIERDGAALCIRDNGIGFDSERNVDVREPFQRLAPAGYSGRGIGLAVVQRIMRRHGGSLRLEASLGGGTSVFLIFPAAGEGKG